MSDPPTEFRAVFNAILSLETPEEREAVLEQLRDAGLRQQVEALLAQTQPAEMPDAHETVDSVDAVETMDTGGPETIGCEAPSADEAPDSASAATIDSGPPGSSDPGLPSESPGTRIGPYKIISLIGEGGFGSVFVAEQEEPIQRRVALKVIKAGMDTREVIARFEAERQALAMMDHRNIARVLDAGATATGRPYFVMEFVDGVPITEYCDEAQLGTTRRLELFIDVCQAVQHAHQKGIIHRDLKPSNILVALREGQPVVKVIDFGIAKATEQKLTEKTLFTAFGQMIGTPIYMSPEQAKIGELDIDTRADVYSLGALLYELLTGSTPIDPASLRGIAYEEMERRIREETPAKPSTRLSSISRDLQGSVSSSRQTNLIELRHQCTGDLDWIVMKALEKDRTRRYESAGAFAQDVRRHLDSEPVLAVAPSAGYKFRKFVSRHRRAVATGTAIAVLLILTTAVSSWLAWYAWDANQKTQTALGKARKAREDEADARKKAEENEEAAIEAGQKAQRRLEQTEQANEILSSVFQGINPARMRRDDQPLRAVLADNLDAAIEAFDVGDATGDPLLVAKTKIDLAGALVGLGRPRRAKDVLEGILPVFEERLGPHDRLTILTRNNLAHCRAETGERAEAVVEFKRVLELSRTHLGPESAATLKTMTNLAVQYMQLGQVDKALPLQLEIVELKKRVLGPRNVTTLKAMNNLALGYLSANDPRKMREILEGAAPIALEELGPRHPETLTTRLNLAMARHKTGEGSAVIPDLEKTLELSRETVGRNHPMTLRIMVLLSEVHETAGDYEASLSIHEDLLPRIRAKHGPEHEETIERMHRLAVLRFRHGQFEEAIALAEETLRVGEPALGKDHRVVKAARGDIGFFRTCSTAEERYRTSLETHGPGNNRTLMARRDLAQYHLWSGELHKAETALVEILQAMTGRGRNDRVKGFTLGLLQQCLIGRQQLDGEPWKLHRSEAVAGAGLLACERHALAERYLRSGYQGLVKHRDSIPEADRSCIADALESLVALYESETSEGAVEKTDRYRSLLEAERAEKTP